MPAYFPPNPLGLESDRLYYYSGKGNEQDLYKGFLESLKTNIQGLGGEVSVYMGDYDPKENKLILNTTLELFYDY